MFAAAAADARRWLADQDAREVSELLVQDDAGVIDGATFHRSVDRWLTG